VIQHFEACCTVTQNPKRFFGVEEGSSPVPQPSSCSIVQRRCLLFYLPREKCPFRPPHLPQCPYLSSTKQGLFGLAFGPMFGVPGYPPYFYLTYNVQLDDGVSWLAPCTTCLQTKKAFSSEASANGCGACGHRCLTLRHHVPALLLILCVSFFFSPYSHLQENARNRLSKFTYVAGDPASTLASEEVLITSAPKADFIHTAGWISFKPSAYGSAVRKILGYYCTTAQEGLWTIDIFLAGRKCGCVSRVVMCHMCVFWRTGSVSPAKTQLSERAT